jgi:hypothetical protein
MSDQSAPPNDPEGGCAMPSGRVTPGAPPAVPKVWSRKLSPLSGDYRITDMPAELKARLVHLAKAKHCSLRAIVLAALTVYAYKQHRGD